MSAHFKNTALIFRDLPIPKAVHLMNCPFKRKFADFV
jgi:hypothetical protein